jgi:hypothetical protein
VILGFYIVTPTAGLPCLRRRRSLASAQARALAEFPEGVEEVRRVSLGDLAEAGVAIPPVILRAHKCHIDAKARKAAATARAADQRRAKLEAAAEARREAKRAQKDARDRLRSLAKAALAREAKRAQGEAAPVSLVVLEEASEGLDLAPWE